MRVLASVTTRLELHEPSPLCPEDWQVRFSATRPDENERLAVIREHGKRHDVYLAALREFNGTTISGGR